MPLVIPVSVSTKRGVFKYIKANGVADTEKVWKKINMMDGIWNTITSAILMI